MLTVLNRLKNKLFIQAHLPYLAAYLLWVLFLLRFSAKEGYFVNNRGPKTSFRPGLWKFVNKKISEEFFFDHVLNKNIPITSFSYLCQFILAQGALKWTERAPGWSGIQPGGEYLSYQNQSNTIIVSFRRRMALTSTHEWSREMFRRRFDEMQAASGAD